MTKCPRCGTEYYSNAPFCYACNQYPESKRVIYGSKGKLVAALTIAAALLFIGTVFAIVGVQRDSTSEKVEIPGITWAQIAEFGVFLISVGSAITAFTVLWNEVPLWSVRTGKSPANARVCAACSLGVGSIIFGLGFFAVGWSVNLDTIMLFLTCEAFEVFGTIMIGAGALRYPRSIFVAKEDINVIPVGKRLTSGLWLVVGGFVLEVGTIAFGLNAYATFPAAIIFFVMIMGIVVILSGAAILLGPFGRPWVPDH